MMSSIFPQYWSLFLSDNQLSGLEVSIPEDVDLSEMGIELVFFDAISAREEANDYYPGIVVVNDGFVPVASCLVGSGNPYFINVEDGKGGPLYRIYHDAVSLTSYNPSLAVERVLSRYEEVLSFVAKT